MRVEYLLPAGASPTDPTYKRIADNVAAPLGVSDPKDLFNLYVYDGDSGAVEKLSNLTANTGVRAINKVLAQESGLVGCTDPETPRAAKPDANGSLVRPDKPWWDDANAGGFTAADACSGSDGSRCKRPTIRAMKQEKPASSRSKTRTSSICS